MKNHIRIIGIVISLAILAASCGGNHASSPVTLSGADALNNAGENFVRSAATMNSNVIMISSLQDIGVGVNSKIKVSGNYAYMFDYNGDFFIFDISNPSAPAQVGYYDMSYGIRSFFISGSYAYFTTYVSWRQGSLLILDISNPSSISEVGAFAIPSNLGGLYVSGSYAYVQLFNSTPDCGLYIIDVSNPSSPTKTGESSECTIPFFVSGNYAYLGNYSNAGANHWRLLNIANPANPVTAGNYASSPFPTQYTSQPYEIPNYAFVSGNYAYISYNSGLQILNISNPASPTQIGVFRPTTANVMLSDMFISGNYAYITGYDGLTVVNISNPAAPTEAGFISIPGMSLYFGVSGNYAYVTTYRRGIQVIDISVPTAPVLAGNHSKFMGRSDISGNYAYIAESYGLRILDISDPFSPREAGFYSLPDGEGGFDVKIKGTYAYFATYDIDNVARTGYPVNPARVRVIDVRNPASPLEVASVSVTGVIIGLSVQRNFVSVQTEDFFSPGFARNETVFDISNPASPVEVSPPPSYSYLSSFFSENYAYMSDYTRLKIMAASNPFSLTDVSTLALSGVIDDVFVSGNYAYMVVYGYSFVIADISNPSAPVIVGQLKMDGYQRNCGFFEDFYTQDTYISVSGNYAYISGCYDIRVIDISNRSAPVEAGYYGLATMSLNASGGYIYVSGPSGFSILRNVAGGASGTSPVVSNCAFSPSSYSFINPTTTTLSCAVSGTNSGLSTVIANLTSIGGSAAAPLTLVSGSTWQRTGITVSSGTTAGAKSITVTATDSSGATGSGSASFMVSGPVNTAPVISSCSFSPANILPNGTSTTTLSCPATDSDGNLSSVTANLSAIGGSASAAMTNSGGGTYTKTGITVPVGTTIGAKTITVTATDLAGATGTQSATLYVISATNAAPVISSCAFSPTTIAANGSAASTLTCSISDANNNISTVTANLSALGGTTTTALTNSSGSTWTKTGISAPTGTVPGAKSIIVTAKDSANLAASKAAALTVTGPTATCSFSPASIPANASTTTTLTCAITGANSISSVYANLLSIGGQTSSPLTLVSGTTWKRTGITAAVGTAAGAKSITININDSAGAAAAKTAALTTTDPLPVIASCAISPAILPANASTTATLTCSGVTDANNNLASVVVNLSGIGGLATTALTDKGGGTWEKTGITASIATVSGSKSLTVTAKDSANGTATKAVALTVTGPTIASCAFAPTTLPANGTTTATLTCSVTNTNTLPSVTVNLASIGGSATTALTNTTGSTWTKTGIAAPVGTTPGAKTFTITATDSTGATKTKTAALTTTDPKPVIASCAISPSTLPANASTTATLTCSGVTDANNNLSSVVVNLSALGGTTTTALTNMGGGTWQKTGITAPMTIVSGAKTLTVTAKDSANGIATSNVALTVTGPTIASCAFAPTTLPANGTTTATLTCSITDANALSSVAVNLAAIGGSSTTALTNTTGSTWTKTGIAAPVGTTTGAKTFTITATDTTGATKTKTAALTITDPKPVIASCSFSPASIAANGTTTTTLACTGVTDANNNISTVYTSLTALGGLATAPLTNNGGGSWSRSGIVCAVGKPVGIKTLTIAAKDAAGGLVTKTATLTVTAP